MKDSAHNFEPKTFIQKICIIVGVVFVFLGAVGILYPEFAGGHFSFAMNCLHVSSGVICFIAGNSKNESHAYSVSIIGAIFTGILGVSGLLFGSSGVPEVGYDGLDYYHFTIIPEIIELGIVDHVINIVLATIFTIGIFHYKKKISPKVWNTKRTIP